MRKEQTTAAVVGGQKRIFVPMLLAFFAGLTLMLAFFFFARGSSAGGLLSTASRQPTRFLDLLALYPEELAACDIAVMNLLCAEEYKFQSFVKKWWDACNCYIKNIWTTVGW